jgi:tripartite-type tricarboxylate transporter receptor subunit TctC
VSKLNAEFSSILQQANVRDVLGKAGLDASASTPEELATIVNKDYPRWGRVIQLKGIVGE